jgi:hypothetical protein
MELMILLDFVYRVGRDVATSPDLFKAFSVMDVKMLTA